MSVCQSPVRAHLLSDTILINYRELPPPRGAGPAPAGGASSPAEPSVSPHPSACSCPGGAGLLSALTLKERVARATLAKCGGRRQATRRHGCLWLSAPALPPGAQGGLMRLRLTLQGAGGLRSWQLAGVISASSHSSLLSIPLFCFPGSSRGCREACSPPAYAGSPVTLGAHLPPLRWGRGNKGTGTAFCETPLHIFFYHFPSQPTWLRLAELVPSSPSLPGERRNLGEPHAPPEQADLVFRLFVVAHSWCRARGQCHLHLTIFLPGDAESES